jgi:hypothetical protein
LIIESVTSLTQDLGVCVNDKNFLIDAVTNSSGLANVGTLYDFDIMPKVNEYVYISKGNYKGYHRVKNTTLPANIIIDTPYIGAVSVADAYVYTYNATKAKTIIWINREGGRSSYTFDERKNYDGLIGANKQFDNGTELKYINRGKNFDYTTVYKSGISDDEVDLIESLRYSIQAWEFDINTNTATPIILDSDNYSKYNTKSNYNDVILKYRKSKYKIIQSQ